MGSEPRPTVVVVVGVLELEEVVGVVEVDEVVGDAVLLVELLVVGGATKSIVLLNSNLFILIIHPSIYPEMSFSLLGQENLAKCPNALWSLLWSQGWFRWSKPLW